MLDPYSVMQDKESHGDIIVWPLKALCDYIEATGDFAFLDEAIAWRREDNFDKTAHADPVTAHIDKLIETVRARFIPGTNLVRYGNGDWNDSLRPVDPTKRDWMTSAWTVVLLYEQLRRYAEILRRAKRAPSAGQGARRARRRDAQGLQRAILSATESSPAMACSAPKAASLSFCCIRATSRRASPSRSCR